MPTVINPFRSGSSPVAQAITSVANSMFGDTLTPALKRQKLQELERQNVETANLMRAVATEGDFDWSAIAPALVGSGYDPQDLNLLARGRAAALYGARDPRTQAAQIGAGGPFSATAEAFDINTATDRRGQDISAATARRGQDIASSDRRYNVDRDYELGMFRFNNEPIEASVNGQNVFVPQGEAVGMGAAPIIKRSEMGPASVFNEYYALATEQGYPEDAARRYAMEQAAKRSSGMRITAGPDGEVTMESGGIGSLGDLTNNVRSGAQKQSIEAAQFTNLADIAREYVADPGKANSFGASGMLRQTAQGAIEAMNNLGITASDVGSVRQEAQENGLARFLPELYDPDLDAIDTVWGMLVYKGASALAGQEGRSVSDKDVAQFKQILGDPKSLFASQNSMAAKLDAAMRIVNSNQSVRNKAMAGAPLSEPSVRVVPLDEEELDALVRQYAD